MENSHIPDAAETRSFTFLDTATVAAILSGANPEDRIHAAFIFDAEKRLEPDDAEPERDETTPAPDPHRVIGYQFIPLLAVDGESVTQAVALLHASGGWSVTELLGYPERESGDISQPDPLVENLLKVTALRIVTPPPAGFEISPVTLHRVFSKPTFPAPSAVLVPQAGCSSCGTVHSEIHPHRNQRASRAIENQLRRYRVIDSRTPDAADWVCFACQGVADENGLSWPFEPWCTTIESDGSVDGRGGVISALLLNGLTHGEGRTWLKKLGYERNIEARFPYGWKRPEVKV